MFFNCNNFNKSLFIISVLLKFSEEYTIYGVFLSSFDDDPIGTILCLDLDFTVLEVHFTSLLILSENNNIFYKYNKESAQNGSTRINFAYDDINRNVSESRYCFPSKKVSYGELSWIVHIQQKDTNDYIYEQEFNFSLERVLKSRQHCYKNNKYFTSRKLLVNANSNVRLVFKRTFPTDSENVILSRSNIECKSEEQIGKISWGDKPTIFWIENHSNQTIQHKNDYFFIYVSLSTVRKYSKYLIRKSMIHDEIFVFVTTKEQPELYITGQSWAIEGSNIILYCQFNIIISSIQWYLNYAKIKGSKDLRISSLTTKDQGYYFCEITSSNQIFKSLQINLAVKAKPTVIVISEEKVLKGNDVVLMCKATFDFSEINVTFVWLKNNDNLETPFHIINSSFSQLTFTNINVSEEGSYQCGIKIRNYTELYTSNNIHLQVNYPPKCDLVSTTPILLNLNTTYLLRCISEAKPKVIQYNWYIVKINETLLDWEKNDLQVQPEQTGKYTYKCSASNSIKVYNTDIINCTFNLDVININSKTEKSSEMKNNNSRLDLIILLIIIFIIGFCIFIYKQWKKKNVLRLQSPGVTMLDTNKKVESLYDEVLFPVKVNMDPKLGERAIVTLNTKSSIEGKFSIYEGYEDIDNPVPFISIQFLKLLGKGCYGEVYHGRLLNPTSQDQVAVKIVKNTSIEAKFEDEIKIHFTLPFHPHVIKCLGKTKINGQCGMVMEFAANGNLKCFLQKTFLEDFPKIFNENSDFKYHLNQMCLKFAWEIASGMTHISKFKLVHRDLATRNILLNELNHCKISDFGLSRNVSESNEYVMESNDPIPVRWLAPESLKDRLFTEKSDVWAFGVVLWEIIALGGTPYSNFKTGYDVKEAVLQGFKLPPLKHGSEEINMIMKICWEFNPDNRSPFSELLKMLDNILEHSRGYINFDNYEKSLYEDIDPNIYKEKVIV